jgi:hypothetical protein
MTTSSSPSRTTTPTRGYTRTSLGALKARELKEMGKVYAVKGYGRLRKAALVEELLIKLAEEAAGASEDARVPGSDGVLPTSTSAENVSGDKQKSATEGDEDGSTSVPQSPHAPEARRHYEDKVREARFAVQRPVESLRDEEHLGDFPSNYDADLLTLLPINPNRAFAWWDIDYRSLGQHYQGLEDGQLVIRLLQAKSLNEPFTQVVQAEIDPSGHSFYFSIEPGLHYGAELGIAGSNGYRRLILSNVMSAPVDQVSSRTDASFVALSLDVPLPAPASIASRASAGTGGMTMGRDTFDRLFGGHAGGAYTKHGMKG